MFKYIATFVVCSVIVVGCVVGAFWAGTTQAEDRPVETRLVILEPGIEWVSKKEYTCTVDGCKIESFALYDYSYFGK